MDFVIISNTDSVGSGRLCAGTTAKTTCCFGPAAVLRLQPVEAVELSSSARGRGV